MRAAAPDRFERRSWSIYLGTIGVLALLAILMPFLPNHTALQVSPAPPAWQLALANLALVVVLYGSLGALGLILMQRLGWPGIWEARLSLNQRLYFPALTGLAVGLFFILVDRWIGRSLVLGFPLHPPFPTSLAAALSAGIGEELLFRLFMISFWVWLFSKVLLKNRAQSVIFWLVSLFSALLFAAAHLPSILFLAGADSPAALSPLLLFEIFLLNGVLSLGAAYWLRRSGFLAAVGVHLGTDLVWHVIWGLLQSIV